MRARICRLRACAVSWSSRTSTMVSSAGAFIDGSSSLQKKWVCTVYCIRSRTHVLSRVSGGPVDAGLAPSSSRPPAARCPRAPRASHRACRLSCQTRAQQSKSQIVKSCNGTHDTGESNQPPAPPEVMRLGGPSTCEAKLHWLQAPKFLVRLHCVLLLSAAMLKMCTRLWVIT